MLGGVLVADKEVRVEMWTGGRDDAGKNVDRAEEMHHGSGGGGGPGGSRVGKREGSWVWARTS